MLAVDPHDRPLPLSDLPRQLQPVESTGESLPTQTKEPTSHFAFVKRWWFVTVAAVAVIAVAVVAVVAFRPKTNELLPPEYDDFGELFSAAGVFPSEDAGK